MKKTFIALLLFSILAGCAKQPTAHPASVTVIVVTATPEPTHTPMPTLDEAARATIAAESYALLPTPRIRPGFPTPSSPTSPSTTIPIPDIQRNISFNELYIGKYVIRSWSYDYYSPYVTYTLSSIDQPQVQIPQTSILLEGNGGLDPLTGLDITGEGDPDAIFHVYTGGNHCCHSVYVYNLGETAKEVFALGTADYPGSFIDLNGDGVYEYETYDPTFAHTILSLSGHSCSYVDAPYPKAIFQYSPERGYVAANLQFADRYKEEIALHGKLIEGYRQNLSTTVADAFSICDVSKLVLDYLYSGQTEKAWDILYQMYPTEAADQYKAIIEAGLEKNVFYEKP